MGQTGASPDVDEKTNGNGNGVGHKIEEESEAPFRLEGAEPTSEAAVWVKIGDLCPECGEAAVVNEEGCRKCYACGYSEC